MPAISSTAQVGTLTKSHQGTDCIHDSSDSASEAIIRVTSNNFARFTCKDAGHAVLAEKAKDWGLAAALRVQEV